MKQIDKILKQVFTDPTFSKLIDMLLVYSLAFVFVFFGMLKVLDISPVRDIVEQSFFIFKNDWAFLGLGIAEVLLGFGLLINRVQRYAAILIVFHLLGTFVTAILNPSITFDSQTVVTTHGEFVAKNIVLIALALGIAKDEIDQNS